MSLQSSMAEALRRTRSGDLVGATALIRTTLSGDASPRPVVDPGGVVLDLKPERVRVEAKRGKPVAAHGTFEAQRHVGPAGRLEYMLYRPSAAAPGLPLVVMLHGCTQSPEDFARGTGMNRLADELGFLVAYPRLRDPPRRARRGRGRARRDL